MIATSMEPLGREEQEIRSYMACELPRREKVIHAGKITSRRIGRPLIPLRA